MANNSYKIPVVGKTLEEILSSKKINDTTTAWDIYQRFYKDSILNGFFNIIGFCLALDIKVKWDTDLNDYEYGYIDTTEKTIYINQNHSKTSQIFTIFHELGHFFLHKGHGLKHRNQLFYSLEQKEEEEMANSFAAEILMPYDDVKSICEQQQIKAQEELIQALLSKFNSRGISRVSRDTVVYRLKVLGFM
ncbi:MAG: ImmA/IrrE family metallo-endopeptidase [Alphaproteobacteria bacterium]|jgi:Zn-dependent peptidase ImmA (M78 family)|nr:ImmA/IrrE family metallo-endopeptidase [Alphaproteobacteria bacterium]